MRGFCVSPDTGAALTGKLFVRAVLPVRLGARLRQPLAQTSSACCHSAVKAVIESAFFADENVLAGKKNWTRILVHEMTHVELATADHRYAHDMLGMKPERTNFSTATCLANAESWAFFAADCAGTVDKGTLSQVLK